MSELLSNHLVEHQYLAFSAWFAALLLLPLLMRGSCQDGREMGSGKASGQCCSWGKHCSSEVTCFLFGDSSAMLGLFLFTASP